MTGTTPTEAERLLAAEFERQGWEYDLVAGRSIVEGAQQRGSVDPAALARIVPGEFLDRNRTTREDVTTAIGRALGGRTIREEELTTLVINNQTYSVDLAGAQIMRSNLNIGPGTQINVHASAGKDDVLAGLATIVASGLAGDWNADAARALAAAIDGRGDIAVEDIREATAEAVEAEAPRQERVRALLTAVAASGLGGALATGISAGLGEAIARLPL